MRLSKPIGYSVGELTDRWVVKYGDKLGNGPIHPPDISATTTSHIFYNILEALYSVFS